MNAQTLIQENLKFSPIYRQNLANHLPMALFALEKMGADERRLQEYFDFYVPNKGLQVFDAQIKEAITIHNWRLFLGLEAALPAFLEFFRSEYEQLGREECLKTYLADLMPGVGVHAFHAVIRLGYALEADNDDEIIFSLAYWAIVFWEIKADQDFEESVEPAVYLKAVSKVFENHKFDWKGNIENRMQLVVEQTGFQSIVDRYVLKLGSFDQIRSVLIQLYSQTQDFTILHGVTSAYAMRFLMPYLEDEAAAVQDFWQAILAAYVTVGMPALKSSRIAHPEMSWSEIFEEAIQSNDEHVIKMVYVCYQEFEFHGEPAYQLAAEQLV